MKQIAKYLMDKSTDYPETAPDDAPHAEFKYDGLTIRCRASRPLSCSCRRSFAKHPQAKAARQKSTAPAAHHSAFVKRRVTRSSKMVSHLTQ